VITADQLVCHAVGDYVIQSDWMASNKTKRSVAALVHAVTYAWPFAVITQSWPALAVIVGTHFVIDRWRLARFVCWAKNVGFGGWDTPPIPGLIRSTHRLSWKSCEKTGYPPGVPDFLAVWLLIIADNVMHVLCNGLALKYLP